MRKTAKSKPIPAIVLHRMALYHCLLTDWLLAGRNNSTTSKELANTIGVTDATVRNDLSYLGDETGVRGVGYSISSLRGLLGRFLTLPPSAPIAFVGSTKALGSIFSFFPPEKFGFIATAFFSEDPSDRGTVVNGHEVHSIEAISPALGNLGIKVAVVATLPNWIQHSVNLLAKAGIKGVLIITPSTEVMIPDGVKVLHIRIPCDLKTLLYHANLGEEEEPSSFEMVL
ncbi:MAG: HTH domain-containing protein [Actinobacteria bacterium]|nr:HTH domain-containing protein [Actinomycetota bacterium]